jgi:hypothetical protein
MWVVFGHKPVLDKQRALFCALSPCFAKHEGTKTSHDNGGLHVASTRHCVVAAYASLRGTTADIVHRDMLTALIVSYPVHLLCELFTVGSHCHTSWCTYLLKALLLALVCLSVPFSIHARASG